MGRAGAQAANDWNDVMSSMSFRIQVPQDVTVDEDPTLPIDVGGETRIVSWGAPDPCDNLLDACGNCYDGGAVHVIHVLLNPIAVRLLDDTYNNDFGVYLVAYSIMAHEFGHVIGLDHDDAISCNTATVMSDPANLRLECAYGYSGVLQPDAACNGAAIAFIYPLPVGGYCGACLAGQSCH